MKRTVNGISQNTKGVMDMSNSKKWYNKSPTDYYPYDMPIILGGLVVFFGIISIVVWALHAY